MCIHVIRIWRDDTQLAALQQAEDSESGSAEATADTSKPYVLISQVLKSILFKLNITMNQFRYACNRLVVTKLEATKQELAVLRNVKVMPREASKAYMVAADQMLRVLTELRLGQGLLEQWGKVVVQQPKQLALGYEALKKSVFDADNTVVMLPDAPLELAWQPDLDMVQAKVYALQPKHMNTMKYFKVKTQLEDFVKWISNSGVNLSRETGPVQPKDHQKFVLKYMGFSHTYVQVPLDLKNLANGRVLSKFMIFLQARAEARAGAVQGGAQDHSYKSCVMALKSIQKLFKWLASTEVGQQRAAELKALVGQVINCRSQLQSQTTKSVLDTGHMIATGVAIPFEELVVHCGSAASGVLSLCSKPENWSSLELARQVTDSIICQLLTELPGQRGLALHCLQVVTSMEDLYDRQGNFALLGHDETTWSLKFSQHKTMRSTSLGTILLEKDSLLGQLLSQFVMWAEDLILFQLHGCPDLEQTKGCAFLSSKGAPYSPGSFYKKVGKVLQVVCCNPNLQLSINTVRHLCADFIENEPTFEGHKEGVSMLAGHTHTTAQRHYLSPGNKAATSSAVLTKSASLFGQATRNLMADAASPQPAAAAAATLPEVPVASPTSMSEGSFECTVSASLSPGAGAGSDSFAPPPSKRAKVSFAKQGRPTTLRLLPGAHHLPREQVESMTRNQVKAHFKKLYGVDTTSQNHTWMVRKLTGQVPEGNG